MSHYIFNLWSIPYLVAFVLLFIVTSIFIAKLSKDGKTILYTFSLAFMTLASLAAFLATNSNEAEIWNTWAALIFFFGLTSMSSFCHFSFLYRENLELSNKKYLFALYCIPIAFLLIFLIDKTILYPNVGELEFAPFGKFDVISATGFDIVDVIWGLCYLTVIVLMFIPLLNFARVFRSTEDKLERKRAAFFILGYIFPLVTIPIDYFLASVFEIRINVMLSMVSLCFTGLLFLIGILGEKLLDPSIIVTKAFKYVVSTVTVALIFGILKELIVEFISESFFSNSHVSSFISVLFAVIILFPIHGAVEKLFHQKDEECKNNTL